MNIMYFRNITSLGYTYGVSTFLFYIYLFFYIYLTILLNSRLISLRLVILSHVHYYDSK